MPRKKNPAPELSAADSAPTPLADYTKNRGKTTVTPEVLLTIARLTTLQTPGVSQMGSVVGGVNRIFNRGLGEGVRIQVKEDRVIADLYVVLKPDLNIREVSRNIQHNVARALTDMIGMVVTRINIHIEDIDYSPNAEAAGS